MSFRVYTSDCVLLKESVYCACDPGGVACDTLPRQPGQRRPIGKLWVVPTLDSVEYPLFVGQFFPLIRESIRGGPY